MIEEFKKFALKGNMVDMAVGIIIGAAFTKLVSSLVDDLIMPPLGLLIGRVDFSNLALVIQKKTSLHNEVVIKYGQFINTAFDFLLLSVVIFMVIRQMNKLTKSHEQDAIPSTKTCGACYEPIHIKATRCPHCTSKL